MRKRLTVAMVVLLSCNLILLSACELSSVPKPGGPEPRDTPPGLATTTLGPGALTTASPKVSSETEPTSSLERARRIKWEATGPGVITSAAALGRDAVYFSDQDGLVYAADNETGQLLWQVSAGGSVTGSPVLAGSFVVLAVNNPRSNAKPGSLVALAASTGREMWRFTIDGEILTSPALAGDLLLVGGGIGFLYAVDAVEGKEKWRVKLAAPVNVDPVIADGVAYSGDKAGNLYAVDVATGRSKWTWHSTQNDSSTSLTSAAIAGGTVYLGGVDEGRVYALDSVTGKVKWQFKDVDPANPPYVEPGRKAAYLVTSAPTVTSGVVYVGLSFGQIGGETPDRTGYLYALDATTGAQKWKFVAESEVLSKPATTGRAVYFASKQGILHAVNVASAQDLWRFEVDAPISASPVVSGNILFLGTWTEGFYALRLSDTD